MYIEIYIYIGIYRGITPNMERIILCDAFNYSK